MFFLQQRIKEERDAKRVTMDGRHEYILSTVSERLGMTHEDAEEFMLDGRQVSPHYDAARCLIGAIIQ